MAGPDLVDKEEKGWYHSNDSGGLSSNQTSPGKVAYSDDPSSSELKAGEESPYANSTPTLTSGSSAARSSSTLKNSGHDGDNNKSFSYTGDKGGDNSFRDVARKVKGKLKNPYVMGGGILGGGILGLIMLLLILAGSLKIPLTASQIESYEFARVTRQFQTSAEDVTSQDLALEAADDSTWLALKEKFTTPFENLYSNIRNTTWGKLDDYRPSQVIKTLGDDGSVKLQFSQSKLTGRKILTGGAIDGEEFAVDQLTGASKWIPGINRILEAKNNISAIRSDIFPALDKAMDADGTSSLVRDATSYQILKETGGGRIGWILSEYDKLNTPSEQAAEATSEMDQATQGGETDPDNAVTSEVESADQAAEQGEKTDATKLAADGTTAGDAAAGAEYDKIAANGGISPTGEEDAEADLNPSTFNTALGIVNPLFAIAMPICLIYDGSVVQSKGTIDNQANEQQNAFNQLAAEADQQKLGDQTPGDAEELANAVAGTSTEIGDITQSIPYERASGEDVDYSTIPSAEAGAGGTYTYSLFTAAGISPNSFAANILNSFVGTACQGLTSAPVAISLGAINIGIGLLTLGESDAVEETSAQSASDIITSYVKNIFTKAVENVKDLGSVEPDGITEVEGTSLNRALRFGLKKGTKFAIKQGVIIGATIGLTDFAHQLVAARAGQTNNGLAQGSDLVNEADSGANIQANAFEQQQLFGRPLLCSEVGQSDQEDVQYADSQNDSKSFTDRYFATSNVNSLIDQAAIEVSSATSSGIWGSIIRLASDVLSPLTYLGSMLNLSGAVSAAPNPCTSVQDYGNVQFGWSQDEENLIASSDSYKLLENQQILDESGKEQAIAQKYSMCFGYSYSSSGNGDLDPTDTSGNLQQSNDDSLGSLLANGDIDRDNNGNVVNSSSALCSPENLTYTNNEFGPQLVFRWRLAMRYDTTMDTLTNEQSVTDSST